jgi:hypothetical protein
VLNGTNLLGKDNLRPPTGNPAETIRLLVGASGKLAAPPGDPFLLLRLQSWLSGLPHRIGTRLYRPNDTEAGWWRWQVTELRCGFARSYRDLRFDVLRDPYELTRRRGDAPGTGLPDEPEGPPPA